jgi:hypothetical protein
MDRLIIVDSDTLLFSAAAVSETRSIEVLHEPSGTVKEFANKTEFKNLMKSKNKQITEDYVIKEKQSPGPLENCLHLVKSSAEQILERFPFDDVQFLAGDEDNFRLKIPLPTQYKSNRRSMLRPIWLKEAHNYFSKKYKARKAIGYETDDLLNILATQGVKQGRDVIILVPDKDARQTIGAKIGNYKTPEEDLVLIEDWHPVVLEDKKARSYGVPWMCLQACLGDRTDLFQPTQLAGVKYGEISVYKDFKNLKTPKECLLKVIENYKKWYPTKFEYTDWTGAIHEADWKSMLRMYWQCSKMKSHEDDKLLADEFFSQYGVDLQ